MTLAVDFVADTVVDGLFFAQLVEALKLHELGHSKFGVLVESKTGTPIVIFEGEYHLVKVGSAFVVAEKLGKRINELVELNVHVVLVFETGELVFAEIPFVKKLYIFRRSQLDLNPCRHLLEGRVFLEDAHLKRFAGAHHLRRGGWVQLEFHGHRFGELLVPAVLKGGIVLGYRFKVDVLH